MLQATTQLGSTSSNGSASGEKKLGDFKFAEVDVEFLVVPSALHEAARAFFDNAKADNLGPCYDCPFIDPYWKIEKIKPLLL